MTNTTNTLTVAQLRAMRASVAFRGGRDAARIFAQNEARLAKLARKNAERNA
jgi:hypothetical protein